MCRVPSTVCNQPHEEAAAIIRPILSWQNCFEFYLNVLIKDMPQAGPSLESVVLKLDHASESPGGLEILSLLEPVPRVPDSCELSGSESV